MQPQRVTLDDLGGGLNQTAHPSQIADNEFTLLENFIPQDRRLVRRNGSFQKSYDPLPTPLTGLLHLRLDDGTPQGQMKPIFGTPQGFAIFVDTLNDRGLLSAFDPYSAAPADRADYPLYSLYPWVMIQLGGVGYAMRKSNRHLIRIVDNGWGRAGITKPAAAPTIAINAAGVMTAGDRTVVYTFRDRYTGNESNPSAESNTITLAADDSVDVSAVATSADPQVNQRRLYINAPGTDGAWLYAGDIDDNITTTINLNIAIRDLGHLASFNNGLPPENLEAGDIFLDSYLVATDGYDLFISEAFKAASFSEQSVFDVLRNDGARVRAVKSFGTRIFVGKTNKVHLFSKSGARWNRDTLSEKHGCYSHHSVQVYENTIIWYGGDDIYISDGNSVEGIGSAKVKRLLSRIPASRKEFVTAYVYPKLGLYVMSCHVDTDYLDDPSALDDGSFPSDRGIAVNNTEIVYNYRTRAWTTYVYSELRSPMVSAQTYGADFEQAVYGTFYDGHYYQFDRGGLDGTFSIRARARSKAFRFGPGAGLVAAVRRLFLHITTVAASITLRLYRDAESVASKERTGLSLDDLNIASPGNHHRQRDEKGFNMRTSEKGAVWQWEIDYTGEPAIEIASAALETIPIAQRVRMR